MDVNRKRETCLLTFFVLSSQKHLSYVEVRTQMEAVSVILQRSDPQYHHSLSVFLFDSVTVCPVWRHQDHLVQKATEVKR